MMLAGCGLHWGDRVRLNLSPAAFEPTCGVRSGTAAPQAEQVRVAAA